MNFLLQMEMVSHKMKQQHMPPERFATLPALLPLCLYVLVTAEGMLLFRFLLYLKA